MYELQIVMFLNFDSFWNIFFMSLERSLSTAINISVKRALIIHFSVLKAFAKRPRKANFIFIMPLARQSISFSLSASNNVVPTETVSTNSYSRNY